MAYHEDWCEIWTDPDRCVCDSTLIATTDPNPQKLPTAEELNSVLKGKTLEEFVMSVPNSEPRSRIGYSAYMEDRILDTLNSSNQSTSKIFANFGGSEEQESRLAGGIKSLREAQAKERAKFDYINNLVREGIKERFQDTPSILERELAETIQNESDYPYENYLIVYVLTNLVGEGVLKRDYTTGHLSLR